MSLKTSNDMEIEMRFTILLLFLIVLSSTARAGSLTQTVRGVVYDAATLQPLPGANIIVENSKPMLGAGSDSLGRFRILNVPVGRITLKAMFIGYQPAFARNVLVYPGKETSVRLELQQDVIEMQEISVTALPKFEPINKTAVVSARMFTVEETDKYAGSRGDVARMASNYAGVAFANDSRNDIVIRGNSPAGLLWRLNGVDIPNPNHFAMEGTTGGPVGMLNNNTLNNSDFITGAFPAEYGNALSGVFDLRMRNGNSDNYEFLGQVGFNGFEFGAEGPISKERGSSFLGNYRYSTLDVMDKLGVDFGAAGVPRYQDFSGKVAIPTRSGRIDWFGLWGDSEIAILDSKNKGDDLYSPQGQDLYNGAVVAASGLSFTHFHNKDASSRLTFSGTYQNSHTDIFRLENDARRRELDDNYIEYKISLDYAFSRRFSARLSGESGLSIDRMAFDLNGRIYDFDREAFYQYFNNVRRLGDGPTFTQLYTTWRYRLANNFSLNAGVNASHFDLNNRKSVDPRIGASYAFSPGQSLSLAYGKHSRLQSLVTYYFTDQRAAEKAAETNLDLDYTRAHHFVLGYNHIFTTDLRMKIEAYYQRLYSVPVQSTPSSYSILNTGSEFNIDLHENLVNTGTGKNYGFEFTLERFYSKGLYFLATLSLFDSRYVGSDGIERNTKYNTNFVNNLLVGKEFAFSERNTLFFDLKTAWAGGQHYTPIDLQASREAGEEQRKDDEAFSAQYPNYFKLDAKIGFRHSSGNITQEWMFYVENLTGHKNILSQHYDSDADEIKTIYQLGVFPMIQYRIYF